MSLFFNQQTIEEQLKAMAVWPDGWYDAQVSKVEIKDDPASIEGKDKKGNAVEPDHKHINVMFTVKDADGNSKNIFNLYLTRVPGLCVGFFAAIEEMTKTEFLEDMKAKIEAGEMTDITNEQACEMFTNSVGRKLKVKLFAETYSGDTRNKIKECAPINALL